MIQWGAPQWLYLLFLLPVIVGVFILIRILDRRRVSRWIEPPLLASLEPDRATGLEMGKLVAFILSLALLVVALARPRWGERLQMVQGQGVAVVIAIDASKSMFAEDVKPNRLERAKTEVSDLIDELAGNAVGIVAFAGDAYVLCPLTTDVEAAKLFLDIISPELMPVPGTDYGKAILKASELFSRTAPKSRALILITDGEDLGTQTGQAVGAARELGIRIYPVAFGTPEGAPIPEKGEEGVVYKRDRSGQVVISRLDEQKMILIAHQTGGRFYRMEGFSAAKLAQELNRLEKEELTGGSFTNLVERFQPFLLAGIALLVLALVLPSVRFLPSRTGTRAIFLIFLLLFTGRAKGDVPSLMRAGNGYFRRGKYQEALGFYQRAEVIEPDALAIHYNIGTTYYRLGRFDEAVQELSLVTVEKNSRRRGDAFYNLGNSFYRMGKLDEAINSYKMALLANPKDRQAKENLEFCLRKRAEKEQQRDSTQHRQTPTSGEEKQQPQPKVSSGMEKEQAERIVQAIESKERQTQREAHRPKGRQEVEKDW